MKKFILILVSVLTVFTLAACHTTPVNNTAVTAELTDEEVNQNSITIKLSVSDPNIEITGTIYARLYDADDNAVSSRSFTSSGGIIALDAVTITFAGLGIEESYTIKIDVTVDRDTVQVESFDFQTIGVIHITTPEQFLEMGTYRAADYVLDNDLDFTGLEFVSPFSVLYFSGTFDGQGHTLRNINISTSRSTTDTSNNYFYIGVFGYVSASAVISNITLDNISIGSESTPQQLDNIARVGFLAGYVASSTATVENITVSNSHMYLTANSDVYTIVGGVVGELKGEASGFTITNSSINLTSTSVDNDGGFLVRLGGAVGFLQPDGELHEVNAEIDLSYETNIGAFMDAEALKVAVGGVIGDNNAITTPSSVTDVVAVGDINVSVNLVLDSTFISGNYALYVGGLVGYSSTRLVDAFFAGNITVNQLSKNNDSGISKQMYVGGLVGYYGVQRANENVVWVVGDTGIVIDAGDDVYYHVNSLLGYEPKTLAHVYGVVGTEHVEINTSLQPNTAPVITDMTDYFSSDFANNAYAALNN